MERVIAFLRAADAEDVLVIGDPVEFELFGNSDLLDRDEMALTIYWTYSGVLKTI